MPRSKIKICGLTNKSDALKLAKLNIFALGFIIAQKDNPKRIDINLAEKIIKKLPPGILSVIGTVIKPGVRTTSKVIEICQKTNPKVLQLQKGGTIVDILKIKSKLPKLKIWKTVLTDKNQDLEKIKELEKVADTILIHSRKEEWPTGLVIAKNLKKPFILAGGLDLNNVKQAIKTFNPFAIDLIRGVETIPGKKDFDKVKKIIQIAKG